MGTRIHMKRKIGSILLIVLVLILEGCHKQEKEVVLIKEETPVRVTMGEENFQKPAPEYTEIVISGVGDIMVHGPQIRAQFQSDTQKYNFENNFKHVQEYLKNSDLMLGNLETTFGGADKGYSSFPYFNTPDELANALKKAGFDALATANNHSYDTGHEGIIRTLDVLQKEGLKTFGTRKNTKGKSYSILDIKGIKVGLSAYTFETPRWGEFKTINAIRIPKEVEGLIDSFCYEFLEEDLVAIKERVKEIKKEGAELVVFYMHWGNEYKGKPNNYQRQIAQALSDYGVDIIFGSHPHQIQSMEVINSKAEDKQTVVIYSLGNFLSNQRYEILNNRKTEDGIIVNIKMRKNLLNDKIEMQEISYVPTWVHRYFVEGKAVFEIIPTYEVIKDPLQYGITSEKTLWRILNSQENTVKSIESDENLKKKKEFKGLIHKI
ncbi:CapA family protein [Alkaliphilus hydrothermalis]|uniref:Poly-gamma-glutamate synthesis protein (Capsule biosynthesis protein) n=1 Tax=Alkaliphilus hydrothermalis TaxID=1482730 RepID=A0ABS2NTJ7_9FIRM|nr:CapA family protein [Alkaliphilus hydrothermalis]MBM7616267.1 poly-gamma-glutamate synthesis protein (capsule biosynthesis protein) [Alkaliphilus hydrothermalis]